MLDQLLRKSAPEKRNPVNSAAMGVIIACFISGVRKRVTLRLSERVSLNVPVRTALLPYFQDTEGIS